MICWLEEGGGEHLILIKVSQVLSKVSLPSNNLANLLRMENKRLRDEQRGVRWWLDEDWTVSQAHYFQWFCKSKIRWMNYHYFILLLQIWEIPYIHFLLMSDVPPILSRWSWVVIRWIPNCWNFSVVSSSVTIPCLWGFSVGKWIHVQELSWPKIIHWAGKSWRSKD